jgi:hypothetical protein
MGFFETKLIIFESVFNDEGMKNLFYKFLKKEANTDPFDFIMEYNELLQMNDSIFKKEKFDILYHKFLKDKSKQELNLSSKDKKEAKEAFEDLDIKKANTVLNNIYVSVKNELKIDK